MLSITAVHSHRLQSAQVQNLREDIAAPVDASIKPAANAAYFELGTVHVRRQHQQLSDADIILLDCADSCSAED